MNKLIEVIRKDNESSIKNISELIKKIDNIITDKTRQYVDIINEFLNEYEKVSYYLNSKSIPNTTEERFEYINLQEVILTILNDTHITIEKLIQKTQNSEVYLSQTYVDETLSLHRKLTIGYKKVISSNLQNMKKLINIMINSESEQNKSDSEIKKHMLYMQRLLEQYPFAIDLYYGIISVYLSNPSTSLYYEINSIVEDDKNRLLNSTEHKKSKKNEILALF